jgi:peptidyl-dipeptidase Dcp
LEKEYKSFCRNGALLSFDEKQKLRELDETLALKSLDFGKKILKDTNTYFLHIQELKNLKGLPNSSLSYAKQLALRKKLSGWVFTLDAPSYIPFITYSEIRSLRKRIFDAYSMRGFNNNNNNTVEIIKNIVSLRKERSKLLGYKSHADFILEENGKS